VFGGFGGLYMLTEYRRGATGWMPAPEFLEVMVGIYELLEAGEEGAARELHARLLPAVVYEHLLGVAWAKRALVRRGVIRTATTRTPTDGLDFEDEHELDIVLSNLSDLLVTPGPLAANASQDRLDGREA
jgi:4-hydroxy-tetrahydrodipicolinate synthase